jgi:multimeric flavodoxin WrbA
MLRLSEMKFRNCEGFYSKAAAACTWPCSITQMDPQDQMEQIYEVLVHWADVVLLATPIRWGAASSLYFRMAERLNCVQNQITLKDNVLIKNKVVGLIVTGGQDNVQAVAGSTLGFFAELGFVFPPFPYIAHSLGWTAENMERNVRYVEESHELKDGAYALLERSVDMVKTLLAKPDSEKKFERGGRKARRLEPELANMTLSEDEKAE